MRELQFAKYQAQGNDFIMVNALKDNHSFEPKVLARLCNRNFGVGADGIIFIRTSEKCHFAMDYYNSDGSKAEICGNGIRCMSKYIYDFSLSPHSDLLIETAAGIKEVSLLKEGNVVVGVKADLGIPEFDRMQIPMLGGKGEVINEPLNIKETKLQVTCLSIGNPHCIIFVEDTGNVAVNKVGPIIENLPVFPRKINVEFVQILGPREIKVRVWERGAGETLACGTGASAAVIAAFRNKLTGRKVMVHLQGGDLEVEWSENNHIYLTGPAEKVFTGTIEV